MSTTTCPIFYPTIEEFLDFRSYILLPLTCCIAYYLFPLLISTQIYVRSYIQSQIEPVAQALQSGICKVVPPQTWWDKKSYHANFDKRTMIIQDPIKQLIHGLPHVPGVYFLTLLEKKHMSVQQIQDHAEKNDYSR